MKTDKSKISKPVVSLLTWKVPFLYLAVLFIPWSICVLVLYFNNFPVRTDYLLYILDEFSRAQLIHPYMLKALAGLAVASWLAWLAFRIGDGILTRWLPNSGFSKVEGFVFGSAIGLGLLSFFTLAAGALRLWYAGVFWGVLGTISVLFLLAGRIPWGPLKTAPVSPAPPWPIGIDSKPMPWRNVWVSLLGLFLLLFLLGDLMPEIFYDALYYHIAVPNLYLLNHRVYSIPTLLFSNFVLTIQMLYGLALTLGNTLSAKLVHGWMGVLLAVAYVSFGKRYLSAGAGLLSGIIFLGLPLVGVNVMTTGCDVGGSFLQFIAAYGLVVAFERPGKSSWVLAGVLTGLAASWKYPAFPVVPIALILVVWKLRWDDRQPWSVVFQDVLWFLVPAMLILAPTLIKNCVLHGNPLYPFGGTHFGTPKIDPHYWSIFISDANTRVLSDEFKSVTSVFQFLFHPWFLSLKGGGNGGFVGPMILILLPMLFLVRTQSSALIHLRRYVVLLWLLWMVSTQTVRYGLPALALLAPLLAETLLTMARVKLFRPYVLGVVLLVSISNLFQLMFVMFNMGNWQVLGGLMSEDAYLSSSHPSYPIPPYLGIAWMNQNLPAGSKILFVGEPRSYYLRFPSIVSAVPDPQPLVEYTRQSRDGADMARRMREEHITHLFVNYAEAVRTEGYGLFLWDKASWDVMKDFWSHYVKPSWKDEQLPQGMAQYVYQLVSEKEALEPHPAPINIFERWAPK